MTSLVERAIPRKRIGKTLSDNAISVLEALFGDVCARDFSISLWDGTFVPSRRKERFIFCVKDAGALRSALSLPLDLAAGRAFVGGRIDIRGDLECAVDQILKASNALTLRRKLELFSRLRRLPLLPAPRLQEAHLQGRPHSRARDRAAIAFHYDQPIEFYASFLDGEMLYSCAYFDEGVETLDRAQTSKMDYILRKVRLRRGERLLDIGCGWGALVLAAARAGAIAVGITLSREQCALGRRRIAEAGLQDCARIELSDYRELSREPFDKIVSVGMFEHVGRAELPQYFKAALEALKPGGLFLNHGIALGDGRRESGKSKGFMQRFIFPDGELVSISDALTYAEKAGFEVRDVENLREHYVRTLRAWINNLERNRLEAQRATNEQIYRAWRLYMTGSAQGFRTARLGLFQSLLARPDNDGGVALPPTRRDLYSER